MTKYEAKKTLRLNACNNKADFKKDLHQFLPYLNNEETIEILTQCAMLASRHGILSHVKVLVEENPEILKEMQCGIFRMSAEIEKIEDFRKIIDYLLQVDKKSLIDVNALDSGFLKECIKREKLEYIQYVIEEKKVVFDIQNSNVIKTMLRYENEDILNYFMVDLKLPINISNENITQWMLKNNHGEVFNKMNKCNMFINLSKKLENKNTSVKVKKI